jgi:hypothetical protein
MRNFMDVLPNPAGRSTEERRRFLDVEESGSQAFASRSSSIYEIGIRMRHHPALDAPQVFYFRGPLAEWIRGERGATSPLLPQ